MQFKYLPSFVKRRGRITKHQESNVKQLSAYEVKDGEDFTALSKEFSKVFIEIGFGDGENIISMALNNPDSLFIGSEVYLSGIGSLIGKILEKDIQNIRIHNGDVRELLDVIKIPALDGILIICPDPWPKARHHKRRLIKKEFLELVASKLKKKSSLYIATDWEDYAENIDEAVANTDKLLVSRSELFSNLPITRFQARAIKEGRKIHKFNLYKP